MPGRRPLSHYLPRPARVTAWPAPATTATPSRPPHPGASPDPARRTAAGVAWGVAAYGAWGVLPLYFRALRGVPPADVVAHRVVWSAVFLSVLYQDTAARHATTSKFTAQQEGWAAMCSALIRHPEFHLY